MVLLAASAALAVLGSGVVTNADPGALAAAMADGGYVKMAFNGTVGLSNTITLASNTVCDATGYNVTISGSNAVQLFVVPPSVTFVLSNFVLADGLAQAGFGGAISNDGTLQVIGCVFSNNGAQGYTTYYPSAVIPGQGGAIFNAGTLLVSNALFVMNWTTGAPGNMVYGGFAQGTPGQGGAIFNAGLLLMSNALFVSNRAEGGPAAWIDGQIIAAANGDGGAFYNSNYAVIDNCLFNANSAIGGSPVIYYDCPHYGNGPGSDGGDATGGAIHNSSTLVITDSVFASNNCAAGLGGNACTWGATAQGGSGGNASGAGIFSASGTISLVGTTFSGNFAVAGDGGAGTDSSIGSPEGAPGGNGGKGGQAAGGSAYLAAGSLNVVNCTFVNSTISAGYGGPGGQGAFGSGGSGGSGGNAPGGAICVSGGFAYVTNATLSANVSVAGDGGLGGGVAGGAPAPAGTNGLAEGESVASGWPGLLTLLNSILSCASGQTNIFGPIIDAGYNLSSDESGFLTNSTSFNGLNPELGSLGNYGGPTPTIPLLPDSPAIDHANPTNFPSIDQRGYPRPYGPSPDIGAFEHWPTVRPIALIDVAFGGSLTAKTGFAANGQTMNDFWNSYIIRSGSLSNLKFADGTSSGVGLTVAGDYGAGLNLVSDLMYASFIYDTGENITVTVTNLTAGLYDVYLYGHGSDQDQNTIFQLEAGPESYGPEATTTGTNWDSPVWQEGTQYVEYANMSVAAGQVITVTAEPGAGVNSTICGLQLAYVAQAYLVPVIVGGPADQRVPLGSNATFSVVAEGASPLDYQWYFNSAAIPGATGSSYTVTNLQAANFGYYSVTVSNSYGTVASLAATLAAMPAALIDVAFGGSLTSKTGYAAIGQTTSDFWNSVVVGSLPLSNLRFADRTLSGAALTVSGAGGASVNSVSDPMYANYLWNLNGDVTVTVSNLPAGVYDVYLYAHGSDPWNPVFFGGSIFQLVAGSESYGLKATTAGTNWNSPVWQNGLQYVEFTNVSINDGQPITITAEPEDVFSYICGLQLASGASVDLAPFIQIQPEPLEESLLLGANAIFSVVAGGSPPLAYQWHFNNAAIFGATNSSYTVTNVQAGSAGVYSVTVSNAYGTIDSLAAPLIGPQPLLEASRDINGNLLLTLYGNTGTNYDLLSTSNLIDGGSWNPAGSFVLTDLLQVIPLGHATNQMQFFRAIRP